MAWYCSGNGSWLDTILGCPTNVLSNEEQIAAMQANFGPGMNPDLVNQSVSEYRDWLTQIDYTGNLNKAKAQDEANAFSITPYLPLLIAIGVFGFVALSAGGPRRYGR